jgi:hypothetical protein
MARFHSLAVQDVLRLPEPRSQPLPECHRHPGLPCTGECQYIAGEGQCLNDIAPPPADLVHEWGRIGSPGTVRALPCASVDAAHQAADRYAALKRRKGYR